MPAGPGEVYRIDPVTGEVRFGNFDEQTGTGQRLDTAERQPDPCRSLPVRGRGRSGNVAPDRLTVLGTTPGGGLPTGITAVTNLGPARDGADEEPIEETLRRAPEELKIRDRAVTAEDYEFLAAEATNDVVIRARLPPRLQAADAPGGGAWRAAIRGCSPASCARPAPSTRRSFPTRLSVPRPEPTQDQIRLVQALPRPAPRPHRPARGRRAAVPAGHRQRRHDRLAARHRRRRGPERVKAETLERIKAFLHPTRGGPDGTGWRVGQPVFVSDLFPAIMPTEDIGYICSCRSSPTSRPTTSRR